MTGRSWYTVGEVAVILHIQRITAWRLVRPYRDRCQLARAGSHPRLCLWVPADVVEHLQTTRTQWWRSRAEAPELARG